MFIQKIIRQVVLESIDFAKIIKNLKLNTEIIGVSKDSIKVICT